ncbi:MAG: ATP-grasp fold amidoligase family protein [Acidaminococcaceae bacterium]
MVLSLANRELFSKYTWLYRKKLIESLVSDEIYIKYKYKRIIGFFPNLQNPRTFTEKLNWLKLHWRNPILTQCADKYEVRKFVEDRGAGGTLKKVYGVYKKSEDIDYTALPQSFVLKVNHGCKQNIFCENKNTFDSKQNNKLLTFYLKCNNYHKAREWSYKKIAPYIICEEHLSSDGSPMLEYNFYCYNGVPKLVEITHKEKPGTSRTNMFDLNLNLLERKYNALPLEIAPQITKEYQQMLEYAKNLSQGFPFVRVDFFLVKNKIYFGEMTFYPISGIYKFNPLSFDDFLGSFLELPKPLN